MKRRFSLDRPQSAERPVSLHPLPFKEAIALLLQVRASPAKSSKAKAQSHKRKNGTAQAAETPAH